MERNVLLSNRLKELCEEKGMTWQALAEKSGMPVKRVYRIYVGQTSNPSVFTMIQICKGLDISLDEFFGTDEFKA